jgi:hypothetical protein
LSFALAERASPQAEIIGIDISEDQLNYARNQCARSGFVSGGQFRVMTRKNEFKKERTTIVSLKKTKLCLKIFSPQLLRDLQSTSKSPMQRRKTTWNSTKILSHFPVSNKVRIFVAAKVLLHPNSR